jgi:sugar lactone lactonase YvrE
MSGTPAAAADAMDGFALRFEDLAMVGSDLRRPECVLTTACGDLYVSDARGGVTRIAPDGTTELFRGETEDGQPLGANGFAMLPDGSFLVAPLIGGGVFRLRRNGQASLFLDAADGIRLDCPNFVLLDHDERIWICTLTQADRRTLSVYPRGQRDGLIVLVDKMGARVVAQGVGYPNEVRVDPTGQYLYANETTATRLLRYRIAADGSLGPAEVMAEFDESNLFDGFTLDSAGGAWITTLISNRLWHVPLGGAPRVLIEDCEPDQVRRLAEMQRGDGLHKSLIYEEHGLKLRNISSLAFGGPDLKTAYMGNLMGDSLFSFRSPVAGIKPAHWNFGPFN